MGGVRGAQAPGHMTLLHPRGALRKQTGRTLGPVSPGEGPAQGWGLWERGAPRRRERKSSCGGQWEEGNPGVLGGRGLCWGRGILAGSRERKGPLGGALE